ncbi:MAG: hypothetical protein P8X73_02075 [Ignavibacteriaceae bacterium]|jgi:hypothetical protein
MQRTNILSFLLLGLFAACSALTLQPANFAWPIESVLPVDENGMVTDDRYSFSFDTRGLFYEELNDSSAFKGEEIRILRDANGFYFITVNKFKNVYVFKISDGTFVMDNKIFISEFGVENPSLNQRVPYVELIDGVNSLYLTNTGIDRDKK